MRILLPALDHPGLMSRHLFPIIRVLYSFSIKTHHDESRCYQSLVATYKHIGRIWKSVASHSEDSPMGVDCV
jgi:hypothetical protein